jgi:hypothetical protein
VRKITKVEVDSILSPPLLNISRLICTRKD